MQPANTKEKTFVSVIAWIRTNKPEKVAEFLHYILCKGITLGMGAAGVDNDELFGLLCDEYEATPLFVEMLHQEIENAEEPFSPGVANPFKSLLR